MTEPSCKTCVFRSGGGIFEIDVGVFRKRKRLQHFKGTCRLHAPVVMSLSTKSKAMTFTEWPEVHMYDWCGDYELAKENSND